MTMTRLFVHIFLDIKLRKPEIRFFLNFLKNFFFFFLDFNFLGNRVI